VFLVNRATIGRAISCLALVILACGTAISQKQKARKPPPKAPTQLSTLRDEYIKATADYKASLEKLLAIYERNVASAEEKLSTTKKLFDEGLMSRSEVDQSEQAVGSAKDKVTETRQQMANADQQIANVLVETQADEELAKNLRLASNRLIKTASFVRYSGIAGWGLNEAWKIQRFFSDTFNKQLPVAVFGQGAIHERWRLDHRNAMDISLHPDGPEGQALLNFLQKNGIPYSAFRSAIPGTATGPHIHIGRPSHRY
jgi:hypothetical protein